MDITLPSYTNTAQVPQNQPPVEPASGSEQRTYSTLTPKDMFFTLRNGNPLQIILERNTDLTLSDLLQGPKERRINREYIVQEPNLLACCLAMKFPRPLLTTCNEDTLVNRLQCYYSLTDEQRSVCNSPIDIYIQAAINKWGYLSGFTLTIAIAIAADYPRISQFIERGAILPENLVIFMSQPDVFSALEKLEARFQAAYPDEESVGPSEGSLS